MIMRRSLNVLDHCRNTIFSHQIPLAIRRSAWSLFLHELTRINPRTSKPFTPRRALSNVLKWMAGQKAMNSYKTKLTPRESKLVRLLVEGLTQKEMALELGCAHKTVKAHLAHVRKKIGVVSTYQVVAVAVEQGWVIAPRIQD